MPEQPIDGTVAFSLGGGGIVWSTDMPADVGAAAERLAAQEAEFGRAQAGMSAAIGRLEAFAGERRGGMALSFGAPGLVSPEAGLSRALREVRPAPGATSFLPVPDVLGELRHAQEQFASYLEQLERFASELARVETRIQGELIGRTEVSWPGDMRAVWSARLRPGTAAAHQRQVGLALAHRALLFRMLSLAVQGGLVVATMIATPAGLVMGLPLAWRFVNQVLAELGRFQHELREETGA